MFLGPAMALFLAAASSPAAPPTADFVSVRASGPYRLEITKTPSGMLKQLIVANRDGSKMTNCPAYFALLDHEFICVGTGQQCGGFYNVATGSGDGDSPDEACDEARASACTGIPGPGCTTYSFCDEMTNSLMSLAGQQGQVCIYSAYGTCGSIACN